ncbi:MAG: UvrB/UvrC motif-containing protein [Puniceicoccales bacterium]|jgi:protein arginine kinase activator|nr:UvrB/UvrC motif-containing protein [Puniceicoccales bacterium]
MGDFIPCSVCGKPANVHLTQISTNEVTKVHLCESCASKKEALDDPILPIVKMLALFQTKTVEEAGENAPESTAHTCGGTCQSCASTAAKTCPRCGFTGVEFLKIRRLGCAVCYKTFEEEINLILPNIQPGVTHDGKIPSGIALSGAIKETIAKAREDMAAAIKSENYEAAARLRDDIRRLETAAGAASDAPPGGAAA